MELPEPELQLDRVVFKLGWLDVDLDRDPRAPLMAEVESRGEGQTDPLVVPGVNWLEVGGRFRAAEPPHNVPLRVGKRLEPRGSAVASARTI